MGAKTWMLAYSSGPPREVLQGRSQLNPEATVAIAATLFPGEKLQPIGDGDLLTPCPPDDELVIGSFGDLTVVAAKEFGIDYPSRLDASFLENAPASQVYLHAMHSVVDWFAFAVWRDGALVRSLSLSSDSGILEDVGERYPFEAPYWSGQRPVFEPGDEGEEEYPFPFHPLDLGEAALQEFFGYQIEGAVGDDLFDPAKVRLVRFKRPRSPWWKLW